METWLQIMESESEPVWRRDLAAAGQGKRKVSSGKAFGPCEPRRVPPRMLARDVQKPLTHPKVATLVHYEGGHRNEDDSW